MQWRRRVAHAGDTPAQDKKYGRTRRELLHEEYVEGSKRGGIGQPKHGFMVRLIVG